MKEKYPIKSIPYSITSFILLSILILRAENILWQLFLILLLLALGVVNTLAFMKLLLSLDEVESFDKPMKIREEKSET